MVVALIGALPLFTGVIIPYYTKKVNTLASPLAKEAALFGSAELF
jgi:hypothetical protein